LILINATTLAAREAKVLEDFNGSTVYRNPITGAHLAPWELRVLVARLQSVGLNDWRRGIMGIYELAREARLEYSKADDSQRTLWQVRLSDLSMRTAAALVEMGDLEGAIRHLKDIVIESSASAKRATMALALQYIQCGYIEEAETVLSQFEDNTDDSKRLIHALSIMANGNFTAACQAWAEIEETSKDPLIRQNHAVCLLYNGQMDKARLLLEDIISDSSQFYALTFNLCTIYELCSDHSRDLKFKLAERIAERDPTAEVYNSDFKL
jgi:tetratricopeptide (TPR) repeat protein